MTKKDYELIARSLDESRFEGHGLNTTSIRYIREQWEWTCRRIAENLAADNPRFDRVKFLQDCGVQS